MDFGLIDRRTQAFITRLSGIRNRLVHDIRNVNQSLRDHVAGLQREGLLELWLYRGEGSEGQDVVEGARRNPKILILFSAVGLLNVLHQQKLSKLNGAQPEELEHCRLRAIQAAESTQSFWIWLLMRNS